MINIKDLYDFSRQLGGSVILPLGDYDQCCYANNWREGYVCFTKQINDRDDLHSKVYNTNQSIVQKVWLMEGCQLATEQANNSVDIVRYGPVQVQSYHSLFIEVLRYGS